MENGKWKMENRRIKKIFRRFCLSTICLSLAFIPVFAQTETPPKPAEPRAATIPAPVEKTLPNGLRVIVVERKNVPLVTAQIMIKSGGEVDPPNLAGTADMTAELLTKGTKTRTASNIAEQMELLGGSINSGAAWDYSSVTFRVMSDKLDKAMAIAADTILNPIFAQDEINRYKTQTLDELSVNLKQPGTLASYVSSVVVFGSEGYGHPLGGTPESLKRITRNDLLKIHQTYYQPNNAVLIMAGDVTPAAAFALAAKSFGNWAKLKRRAKKQIIENVDEAPTKGSDKVRVEKITVVDLPGSGQAAVNVAQFGFSIMDSPSSYYKGLVANSVLGGGYSSRLNQEIRIKRGLSYGAGSALSARREGGIFSVRAQTKNESAAEVAGIMIDELDRLAAESIAESELTPRKATLVGDFSRELETTGGLVRKISQLALYDLNLNEINRYIQNVQDVNDEQTRDFIKNLFGEYQAQIVIVGDAKTFLPDLQKRFPSTKIETISAADLDLNNVTLRKPKTIR